VTDSPSGGHGARSPVGLVEFIARLRAQGTRYLEFANVREHPLEWIWSNSDAFARFRGTDWMKAPCRTCPLGRQEVDWGGCRCQALRLTGDAGATDPVCRFSAHHDRVVLARDSTQTDEFVYRTMKRPART
jgi:pyrroloquinoline quinone biosynthesis protein E